MHARMKRILPLFLLCVALFALALCAAAETKTGTCGDTLTYTLDTDTGVLTISGTGEMEDWDWRKSAPWDSDRASIRSLIISKGVASIGNYAFKNCDSLTSVSIANGVTSIGEHAFENCDNLTDFRMPDSVTRVGRVAFALCRKLRSIRVPSAVTSIGERAFAGCVKLTGIYVDADNSNYTDINGVLFDKSKTTLLQAPGDFSGTYIVPDGVLRIGHQAFFNCHALTNVSIPASVTTIEDMAFYFCCSLVGIRVDADNPNYIDIDGVLFSGKNGETLSRAPGALSGAYTVPDCVTSIGDAAFSPCLELTSVTIPDSVASIGYIAFDFCDSLTSITILNSNCEIYDDATTIPDTATIYGYSGSTAEAYAKEYDRTFVAMDKSAKEYKQGDIITFGSYPQSEVTDSALLAKLDAQDGSWVSYDYYIEGEVSDFMQYKDVTLNGEKYRAVRFSSYRPSSTYDDASLEYAFQAYNGYYTNTVYWFKYEPVKWRVLDASDRENLFVLSENILDSQAFRNTYYYSNGYYTDSTKTYYANNYPQSDIRAWLNGDFYNTTFSTDEKSHIHTTTITNEAYPGYSQYDAASTQDKVFLLSYAETTNSDYFSNSDARCAKGSDYAKAQGLRVYTSSGDDAGNSRWQLRSAGYSSDFACNVYDDGDIGYYSFVYLVNCGIRVAFRFNPISSNPIEECEHSWTVTATQPATCTTPGSKTLECTKCGETKTEVIPATGEHTYVDGICKDCGAVQPVTEYKQGDILTYGSYPQTQVTDSALIAKLDAQEESWVSYNYYIEDEVSDFMQYKDVTLDGEKYRAVKFSSYRPFYIYLSSSTDNSYQDDNGYNLNTVYWFKYEPVKWRVLDATDQENLLVISESILDAQAFRNTRYSCYSNGDIYYYTDSSKTYYANNYAQSDIRAWLNGDFYNAAFSADEMPHIRTTTITNEAYNISCSRYDAASTRDKVFLLSYAEARNSTYFSDGAARCAKGSDYAKAQGLGVCTSSDDYDYAGNSWWQLRSAGYDSSVACNVGYGGYIYYGRGIVSSIGPGVRPAFRLNPTSSALCTHIWTVTATQAANCTTPGSKTSECTKCGETKTEVIPVNDDHDYSTVWTVDTPATCTAVGSKSHHCTRCDAKTDITEIPKAAHTYVDGVCKGCGKVKPAFTPGVVTGEGETPMKKDLLRLQKYLAGWDVEIDEAAADCNGDGQISKADLLRLQKYLAGWDVKLGE